MIDRFVTFKEPTVVEDHFENDKLVRKGGIIFRSHVIMTDGHHLIISDAQHGSGMYEVNETLVFPCDDEGSISDWSEVSEWGGRFMRTEECINLMNQT